MATTALVNVLADTSRVDDQLQRDLNRILNEVQRQLPGVQIRVDDTQLNQFVRDAQGRLRDARGRFVAAGSDIGRALGQGIGDGSDSASLSLGRLGATALTTLGSMTRLTVGLGLTAGALGGISLAAASAVTALGGVEGIANQAAGALGVFVAARGVLTVALSGISEAFDALGEDAETFNKAIEDLAPAAQSLAREFRAAVPRFAEFRDGLQQAMFVQLEGADSANRLADALKQVQPEAQGVAERFGQLAAGFVDLLTAPRTIQAINQILVATQGILDKLAPVFLTFVDGAIQRAAAGTAQFGETFAVLRGVFEAVTAVAQDLGRIFTAFGTAAETAGTQVGGPLAQALDAVADILNSGPGQEFLVTLNELTATIIAAAVPVLLELVEAIVPVAQAFAVSLQPVINALSPVLVDLADTLGRVVFAFTPLLPLLADLAVMLLPIVNQLLTATGDVVIALAPAVIALATALVTGLEPILTSLPTTLQPILDEFTQLAVLFGETAAELFTQLAPSFEVMGQATADLLAELLPLVVEIADALQPSLEELIPIIEDLTPVIVELARIFSENLASFITNIAVPALRLISSLLRGDLSGALTSVRGLLSGFARFFRDAFQSMRDAASRHLGDAVKKVRDFPARARSALGDLGSYLYNAGRALIGGFISGMRSRLGDIRDAASGLLSAAKNFFPHSPAPEGPFSGRGYTTYSGMAMIDDLIAGIRSRHTELQRTLAGVLGGAQVGLTGAVGAPAAALGRGFGMQPAAAAAPSVAVFIGNEEFRGYVDARVETAERARQRLAAQGVRR